MLLTFFSVFHSLTCKYVKMTLRHKHFYGYHKVLFHFITYERKIKLFMQAATYTTFHKEILQQLTFPSRQFLLNPHTEVACFSAKMTDFVIAPWGRADIVRIRRRIKFFSVSARRSHVRQDKGALWVNKVGKLYGSSSMNLAFTQLCNYAGHSWRIDVPQHS